MSDIICVGIFQNCPVMSAIVLALGLSSVAMEAQRHILHWVIHGLKVLCIIRLTTRTSEGPGSQCS